MFQQNINFSRKDLKNDAKEFHFLKCGCVFFGGGGAIILFRIVITDETFGLQRNGCFCHWTPLFKVFRTTFFWKNKQQTNKQFQA